MSQPTAAAKKFPDEVIVALHETQLTLSCIPVQIDDQHWQAALFYVLPPDAPCLGKGALMGGPFAVGIEADTVEHENATLIEIGIDISVPVQPLQGTLLFLTGHSTPHHEALKLLTTQQDLPLFLGDQHCNLLWQQRVPLGDGHRDGFKELLDEAIARDAVIRMTGRYDPDAAFADSLQSRRLI